MKKTEIINVLTNQMETEKKTTRAKIIAVVIELAKKHLRSDVEYHGLVSTTSQRQIINLGNLMEVIIAIVLGEKTRNRVKSNKVYAMYRNNEQKYNVFLNRINELYDIELNGQKCEIKRTTTDAPAHRLNNDQKVDKYIIASYSIANGGNVFVFNNKNDIIVDRLNRAVPNQKMRFLDKELTAKVFG